MKKGLVEIVCVLDASGSMYGIKDDTIGGFNEFLKKQRKLPGLAKFTLVLFDSNRYMMVYDSVNITDVPDLTSETYVPGAMTPLLDSMGKTIDSVGKRLSLTDESERPEKVIFSIMTDGYENDSRTFTRTKIADMIKHQTNVYSWEFIFLGANQDAIAEAQSYNIPKRNAYNWKATASGTREAIFTLGCTCTSFRGSTTSANTAK